MTTCWRKQIRYPDWGISSRVRDENVGGIRHARSARCAADGLVEGALAGVGYGLDLFARVVDGTLRAPRKLLTLRDRTVDGVPRAIDDPITRFFA